MKTKNLFALAAAALALSLGASPAARAEDDHHHHGAESGPAIAGLKLDNGKKWQIDPPLREGMAAIRNEMAAALEPIHAKTYSPAQYAALADRVETHVRSIMTNCKLPPAADAQLHLVIADFFAGARLMKEDGDRMSGAVRIVRALGAYPKYFDHAGWKPLQH